MRASWWSSDQRRGAGDLDTRRAVLTSLGGRWSNTFSSTRGLVSLTVITLYCCTVQCQSYRVLSCGSLLSLSISASYCTDYSRVVCLVYSITHVQTNLSTEQHSFQWALSNGFRSILSFYWKQGALRWEHYEIFKRRSFCAQTEHVQFSFIWPEIKMFNQVFNQDKRNKNDVHMK